MLKERGRQIAYWVWTADLVLTALAFVLAWWLRSAVAPELFPGLFPGRLYPLSRYLGLLPLVLAIWTVLLLGRRTYGSRRTLTLRREAWDVVRVVALGTLSLAAAGWLLRIEFVSRPFLLLFAALDLGFLLAEKLAIRLTARWVRRQGLNYRTLLIVGLNDRAAGIADEIRRHDHWGFKLLGFVAPNGEAPERFAGLPVLGTADDLGRILEDEVVDDVLFVLERRQLDDFEEAFLICSELGIRTRVALSFPHMTGGIILEELEGMPLLTFTTTPGAPFQLFLKRLTDLVVSGLALLLLAPLLLLVALAIRLESRGPVLFRQTRCGLNGRRFTLYKFRTMVDGAEAMRADVEFLDETDGPVFKSRRDPRVTRVGRWLRKSSLDETPQLLNVLAGQMSLVGPRPPIPAEVARYERWQRRRLSMKPGLTGPWQVSGRSEIGFDSWIRMDLAYIDDWSLWLDLKILARTVPAVLSTRGAA